jgi:protein-L-isoaspartate O-methyltransferase
MQTSCCEPENKAECCGSGQDADCGCSADAAAITPTTASATAVRETVREKYAAAARTVAAGADAACCSSADEVGVFGSALYADTEDAPHSAVSASLGCGVPTAVADLHEGETVLDLGSGAGADVLISARRVGATGKAIGLDMTDEMLELARSNAAEATSRRCRSPMRPSTLSSPTA